jgi:NTE family protein
MNFRFSKVVLFLFLIPFFAFAQDTIPRPKIGLVLSGGGAKGLAHIGVLKMIDEYGIKIDYIGGTSMGAVVGGLYAAGYTGIQIDSIFNVADYDAIIRDYTPRASKDYRERENNDRYAVSLPFNKFKVGVPISLSQGLYNYNLLTRLLHHVRHVRDFKKLPIPFVCVATDIETGEEVVLDHGFLSQAIVASGALPTLYAPVNIDGKYLIDGGILNNFPVQEVKNMGADLIIGVDVQYELKAKDELNEATKLLSQISNLQMIKKMEEKKSLVDIYIKPNINDFTVVSFEKGTEIVEKGIEATKELEEQLKKLSANYKVKKTFVSKSVKDSLLITAIEINDLANYTDYYIQGKLRFKPGKKVSYSNLVRGIDFLNTTQNFSSLSYTLNQTEEGDALNLFLVENKTKTFLKFGLHFDGLFKSGVLVNVTKRKLLFKNDVFSADVVLGDNYRYFIDYNVDIGYNLSVGVNAKLYQFNRNVNTNFSQWDEFREQGINSINLSYRNFSHQLYFQTLFVQKFSAKVGLEYDNLRFQSETFPDYTSLFDNGNYLSLFVNINFDSLDNKFFPKSGWSFTGDGQSYLASSEFDAIALRHSIFKAEATYAQSLTKKLTFIFKNEGGFTIGERGIPLLNFFLGGYGFKQFNNFRHFYGYNFVGLTGNSYVMTELSLDYEIFKKNHINLSANFANVGNDIFVNDGWFKLPTYSGYAAGYGIETFLGPIEIKQSWSPETKESFTWFSVGFWF